MTSPTAQQSGFQLGVLRLIAGWLSLAFALAGVWAEFDPGWARYIALGAATACAVFTVVFIWMRRRSDATVRAFLVLMMAAVFMMGLTIQPLPLGTLSGFVLLGIAVGIASYESLVPAVVTSLMSVALGVLSILLRSSVPGPATGVFLAVASISLFAVFGFRRVAAQATAEAIADSLRDPLTGITNRRGLALGTSLLSAIADRSGQRLGCLILDLDHFKAINDGHGHEAGDRVLVAVAKRIQRVARQGDLLVRLGGEEFALFTVVNSTSELSAIGERVRAAVEQLTVGPRVTTSVGGALHPAGVALRLENLMNRADRQLYAAKGAGRNAVRVASD